MKAYCTFGKVLAIAFAMVLCVGTALASTALQTPTVEITSPTTNAVLKPGSVVSVKVQRSTVAVAHVKVRFVPGFPYTGAITPFAYNSFGATSYTTTVSVTTPSDMQGHWYIQAYGLDANFSEIGGATDSVHVYVQN